MPGSSPGKTQTNKKGETMNLLDAIKTGRRFRRPYMACKNQDVYQWIENSNDKGWNYVILGSDILATDWEIEVVPKSKAWMTDEGGFIAFSDSDTITSTVGKQVRAPWLDEP